MFGVSKNVGKSLYGVMDPNSFLSWL